MKQFSVYVAAISVCIEQRLVLHPDISEGSQEIEDVLRTERLYSAFLCSKQMSASLCESLTERIAESYYYRWAGYPLCQ